MAYLGIFIMAVLACALVLVLKFVPEIDPKQTSAGAMADLNDISDRVLAVRNQVLQLIITKGDSPAIAGELLFISDDVKDAADRFMVAALTEAQLMRTGGSIF